LDYSFSFLHILSWFFAQRLLSASLSVLVCVSLSFGAANGKAHLPAPGLQNRHSEKAHQQMQKGRDTRSAEGAGQVQRGLARLH